MVDRWERIQDSPETLYRSLEHSKDTLMLEREELDGRDLTQEGLETME
ncbi:MAG: hypothetical protein J07AB43_06680 [Candidatus Nanosalina sp. J07AB43]|nr:MAG: hypothetical protein J07AB43_06680 [Candidatus Nanosalina sp. J07AB43]